MLQDTVVKFNHLTSTNVNGGKIMNSQTLLSNERTTQYSGQRGMGKMHWEAPELSVLIVSLDTGYAMFSNSDCGATGALIHPTGPGGCIPPGTDPGSSGGLG